MPGTIGEWFYAPWSDTKEAVWSFEKALEINPENAHAWHNKGVALSRLGLDTEAKFAFSCAGWIGVHGGH